MKMLKFANKTSPLISLKCKYYCLDSKPEAIPEVSVF